MATDIPRGNLELDPAERERLLDLLRKMCAIRYFGEPQVHRSNGPHPA